MGGEKRTYEALEARLAEAERIINGMRNGQIDAVIGKESVHLLRLREMEEAVQKSKERLRESEEKLRCLTENIENVYWLRTPKEMLYVSPMYEKLWGKSCDSLYENPSSFLDAIHPNDRARIEAAFQEGQSQGGHFKEEFRIVQPDGSLRWILARTFPVTTHSEKRWRAGIAEDITERKQMERMVNESEARLNAVLDTLLTGIVITDADGRIVRDNAATRELWGVPPETDSWEEYSNWVAWWPDTGERIKAEEWAMTRALLHGEETRNELVENQPFGSHERRYYLNNVAPLRNAEGEIIGGVAGMLDVTEAKLAEDKVRSLAKFPSENPNPVMRFAKDGTLLYANDASHPCLKAWQCELGQCLPDDWHQQFLDVIDSGSRREFELDCENQVFSLTIAPIVDADYVNVYGLDISERKKAEKTLSKAHVELDLRVQERTAELKKLNEDLRKEIKRRKKFEFHLRAEGNKVLRAYEQRDYLSRRLVELLERERYEIGSTLHDQIGQILTGVSMQLEGLKEIQREGGDLAERVEPIQGYLQEAMIKTRSISNNLRSDVLERFGLIPSLRNLIEQIEKDSPFKIYFFTKNVPENLRQQGRDLTIYRVVQEALTNVIKHAEAKEVFINLTRRDGKVCLTIEDDGMGFDYNSIVSHKSESFYSPLGLTIMRERLSLVSGAFRIESAPGKGTCVFAEIPYPDILGSSGEQK